MPEDLLKKIEKEILRVNPTAKFTIKENSTSKLSIEIHSILSDDEWDKVKSIVVKYSTSF